MVVLDVSVPTGFAPVSETLDRLLQERPKIKRYDVAGRKVIIYIEDMAPGENISFSFDVQALYPVRGKGGASQAYSYTTPDAGEAISEGLTVQGDCAAGSPGCRRGRVRGRALQARPRAGGAARHLMLTCPHKRPGGASQSHCCRPQPALATRPAAPRTRRDRRVTIGVR
jgi:hypothetical protein